MGMNLAGHKAYKGEKLADETSVQESGKEGVTCNSICTCVMSFSVGRTGNTE